MQAVYPSRIDWKDEPSTNTPLGANNLNKMDYALYEIDKRVLTLGGYEERAALSATNSKTSENNAKVSETNAKISEINAKDYMERAYATTPEGYDELVEKVSLMDIATTTESVLKKSKQGGLKINHIKGATEQNKNIELLKYNGGLVTLSSDGETSYTYTLTSPVAIKKGKHTFEIGVTRLQCTTSNNAFKVEFVTNSYVQTLILEPYSYLQEVEFSADATLSKVKVTLINATSMTLTDMRLTGKLIDYPQAIKNVGDCVEMIQGYWRTDFAIDTTTNYIVCNKKPIPCKSGDDIQLKCDKTFVMLQIMWYADGVFMDTSITNNADSVSATIPSGATGFCFNVRNADSTTPLPLDTVGKISLTVNGKYVTPIKSHGKNLLNNIATSQTTNGVTFTVNKDKSVTANGTTTANTELIIGTLLADNGTHILSGCPYNGGTYGLRLYNRVTHVASDTGNGYSYNVTNTSTLRVSIFIPSGVTLTNATFCPMIRLAEVTDDTYEPYQETTAYIYTDEPIRDSDVVFNDNGVWKVERNVSELVCDGDEGWKSNSDTSVFYVTQSNIKPIQSCVCDSYNNVHTNSGGLLCVNASDTTYTTLNDFVTSLSEKPITVQYKLATPTYETLDTASQIALNRLETFDTVTYIEVDSRVQPGEIKVEYGTSKVGAYTLKSLNDNDIDRVERTDIKAQLNELQVALVALGSEV